MSDQETPQPSASEEHSSSSSASSAGSNRPEQQQRERRAGGGSGGSSERGERGERGERSRRRHRRPHNAPPSSQHHSDSSLNLEELRELMEMFTEHGLTEFEFEREDFRVHLGRNPAPSAPSAPEHSMAAVGAGAHPQHDASHARQATSAPSHAASGQGAAALPVPHHPGAQAEASASADEDLHIINSPIVGTFYRSPSPTAEPFVRIGSRVEHDTVVCIIEAMKLMNEIQSETSGEVVKIYVENGQPVEYGQPLFGIRK